MAAGVYRPESLAGYRNQPVYIQGSRHVPPRHEVLPDAMDILIALLEEEPHPDLRAVCTPLAIVSTGERKSSSRANFLRLVWQHSYRLNR